MIGMSWGISSKSAQSGSLGMGMTTATDRVSAMLGSVCRVSVVAVTKRVSSGCFEHGRCTGLRDPDLVAGVDGVDAVDAPGVGDVREVEREVLLQRHRPGAHGVEALQVEHEVAHDLGRRPRGGELLLEEVGR